MEITRNLMLNSKWSKYAYTDSNEFNYRQVNKVINIFRPQTDEKKDETE